MDNKVNRITQDRINTLSKQDLEDLAESYLGKYAFIIFDTKLNDGTSTLFTVSKIVGYESLRSWFPNGLDFDDKDRDRKIGDKTILFQLENGQSWELVDFATIGDTLNVKDRSGGGYSNYEIVDLDTTLLNVENQVDGARLFNLPITRKAMINPMLMGIGWIRNRNGGQQAISQQTTFATTPTRPTTSTPFTSNKSNVLRYLQVSQEVSDGFPQDIKEFIEIIDGSQEIYAESKDSSKKEKLADLIVGWMRALMEFLKTQNLGIYALANVNLEQQTLPQDQNPPTPPTPPSPPSPPTPPQDQPHTPPQQEPPDSGTPPPDSGTPPPPSGGTPPPPSGGTPPPSGGTPPPPIEHKPPFTKEELEDAIASADYMCEIGDEDSCKELVELRKMYNRYYS